MSYREGRCDVLSWISAQPSGTEDGTSKYEYSEAQDLKERELLQHIKMSDLPSSHSNTWSERSPRDGLGPQPWDEPTSSGHHLLYRQSSPTIPDADTSVTATPPEEPTGANRALATQDILDTISNPNGFIKQFDDLKDEAYEKHHVHWELAIHRGPRGLIVRSTRTVYE